MSYNAKAIIIELILIIVSVIVMFVLDPFLVSIGLKDFSFLSAFIPTTTFGLYVLFGKYVYLRGPVTKKVRIIFGLYLLLLMPAIWFIMPRIK